MDPQDEGNDNDGGHPEELQDAEDQYQAEQAPAPELAYLAIIEREAEADEYSEDSESSSDSDISDNGNVENNAADEDQHYEISQSLRHEYLGTTEELSGRTLVDEDCVTIPILSPTSAHNLVLLPNQTLPITVFCPVQQSMLHRVIEKDRIIGIIHSKIGQAGIRRHDKYGTIAEIYEFKTDENRNCLSVITKGRQRFKVVSTHREITGCLVATVRILPEIRMPDPLYHIRLPSQFRHNMSSRGNNAGQMLCARDVKSTRSAAAWKSRKQTAHLTSWPSWVYDLYDDEQLAVRLINDIVAQYDKLEYKLEIPRDPQELSHWAAINLPLTESQRVSLLSLNTATQRLRFILSITSYNNKGLFCNSCGRLVANTNNIFTMSTGGPQGTFVNPDGFIHEMITVTKANNLRLFGNSCTVHSWFPGYAWTIANCSYCHSHIGWLFSAKKLKPKKFFGISTKCVKTDNTNYSNPLHNII